MLQVSQATGYWVTYYSVFEATAYVSICVAEIKAGLFNYRFNVFNKMGKNSSMLQTEVQEMLQRFSICPDI